MSYSPYNYGTRCSAAENVHSLTWEFPLGRLVVDERRRRTHARLVSPFGEDSFVQVHHDGVLRFQFAIEKTAHVTSGPDRILKLEEAESKIIERESKAGSDLMREGLKKRVHFFKPII